MAALEAAPWAAAETVATARIPGRPSDRAWTMHLHGKGAAVPADGKWSKALATWPRARLRESATIRSTPGSLKSKGLSIRSNSESPPK